MPNTWLHLDIPLSSYTNANHSLNLHHINQMGLIDNNAGQTPGADYYIDNQIIPSVDRIFAVLGKDISGLSSESISQGAQSTLASFGKRPAKKDSPGKK